MGPFGKILIKNNNNGWFICLISQHSPSTFVSSCSPRANLTIADGWISYLSCPCLARAVRVMVKWKIKTSRPRYPFPTLQEYLWTKRSNSTRISIFIWPFYPLRVFCCSWQWKIGWTKLPLCSPSCFCVYLSNGRIICLDQNIYLKIRRFR